MTSSISNTDAVPTNSPTEAKTKPFSIVPFNKPLIVGTEIKYLTETFEAGVLSGNGTFSKKCIERIGGLAPGSQIYLTTSGTSALEFAAILADIRPGDEVILPSFTYVSTANAFRLQGATLVFIDVDPKTMCLDASLIEPAITRRTRAIVPVHYASIPADMPSILALASQHNILVIEDAAPCLLASSENKQLGSIGHIGCFSFHETKNYSSGGQGGCIMVNDKSLFDRAERIYEYGTNRRAFMRGETPAYIWTDRGSNFYMSETAAACLWAALEVAEEVTDRRREIWHLYESKLKNSEAVGSGDLELPYVPEKSFHNGHIFWMKARDKPTRDALISSLRSKGITAPFHFTALHSTSEGRAGGKFSGLDKHTTEGSNRLIRLPIFFGLTNDEVSRVVDAVIAFFKERHVVVTEKR